MCILEYICWITGNSYFRQRGYFYHKCAKPTFIPVSRKHGHLEALQTRLVEPLLTPVTLEHLQVPPEQRERRWRDKADPQLHTHINPIAWGNMPSTLPGRGARSPPVAGMNEQLNFLCHVFNIHKP